MAQGLDLTLLEKWIREHVPAFDGDLKAEKFAGGQSNPTFKLTAGDRAYVLRRKPQGTLLASAHAVESDPAAIRVSCVRGLIARPRLCCRVCY